MENKTYEGSNFNSSNETSTIITSKSQKVLYCDLYKCVPVDILLLSIAVIGIIANVTVIVTILHSKKLRKPIYIGISMLALPDLTFLTGNLVILLSYYLYTLTTIAKYVFNTFILTAYFTSTCHIVLLSLQQYFYLEHPLKSHIWFTVGRMCLVSLTAWIISAIFAMLYMFILIVFRENISAEGRDIFMQVMTFLSSLVPVIALAVLYVLKRMALQKSLVDRRSVPVRRMSRLVSFVVIAYLLCTTPINIRDIIEYSFNFYPRSTWELLFSHVSFVLLYCNFTINPFLYFIMTPRFLNMCRPRNGKKLHHKKTEQSSNHDETGSTLVQTIGL